MRGKIARIQVCALDFSAVRFLFIKGRTTIQHGWVNRSVHWRDRGNVGTYSTSIEIPIFVAASCGRRRRQWIWSGWGCGFSTNAFLEIAICDAIAGKNTLLTTALFEGFVKGGTGRSIVSIGAAHVAILFFKHVPFALSARSGRRGWSRIVHLLTIFFIVNS